jgi:putative Mg2+ transporter-C (MgtC) family protein
MQAAKRLGFFRYPEQNGAMYAGNFAVPYDTLDVVLRLVAATLIGIGLGLERMLRGKPTGMRTMGLVTFAAALVTLSATHARGIIDHPDALSRVLQGVIQGVLVGIGFLGAAVVVRDPQSLKVINLTTAAEVWAVGATGIATACAPWVIVGVSIVIFVTLMVALRALEKKFHLKEDH